MSDASELDENVRPSYEYEVGRFPERLREAIGERSIRSFAAECGLSDTVLRQYLSGKSEPTRMALIAIAREAGVRIEWLVSGSGTVRLEPTPPHLSSAHNSLRARIRSLQQPATLIPGNPVDLTIDQLTKYLSGKGILTDDQLRWIAKRVSFQHVDDLFIEPPGTTHTASEREALGAWCLSVAGKKEENALGDFVLVPRYEVSASAGGGASIHSEQVVDYLSFKRNWVKDVMGLSVGELALINVKGDSMEPTLSSDDMILVDLRTKKIQENAIYVLQLNGGLLVKRIQRKLDGTVIVKGDNPIYEPEVLQSDTAGMLNVIGRVVWCGRKM